MNLLFRLVRVAVGALGGARLEPLAESVLPMRVLPGDLDLNVHMNNGRFLSVMDLGRMDLVGRMGLAKIAMRKRWRPMVGSATIRFRRPLRPFERYELRTRILGWDEKWFFIVQRFEAAQGTAAVGMIKGLFRSPKGNVPPSEILKAVGHDGRSPPLPDFVAEWVDSEQKLAAA